MKNIAVATSKTFSNQNCHHAASLKELGAALGRYLASFPLCRTSGAAQPRLLACSEGVDGEKTIFSSFRNLYLRLPSCFVSRHADKAEHALVTTTDWTWFSLLPVKQSHTPSQTEHTKIKDITQHSVPLKSLSSLESLSFLLHGQPPKLCVLI